MTKLSFTVSASTYKCSFRSGDTTTANVLGAPMGASIQSILADEMEFATLKDHIDMLISSETNGSFETLNLVFNAPNAPPGPDRSPISGVFRAPIRAIHTSGEQQLSCFVYLERLLADDELDTTIQVTAVEYSRRQREKLLRREFGSWLLEDHIEKSVIATDLAGNVVFWNRFASELYQWTREETIGQNIMNLTPTDMTQEQGTEIFAKLTKGEHWKGFFKVQRKDSTQFMAHVADTPVLDNDGNLKFIVGVSADYTHMHNLMAELKELNTNLEREVDARTKQLLEREKSLRMVGAAVKESDTGFIITDDDFSVVWVNSAVPRMLQVEEEEVLYSVPWNLPIAYYDEGPTDTTDLRLLFRKPSGTFTVTPTAASQERKQILSVSVQPMSDAKQRMYILRDLTAEHEAASARRAAEAAAAASQSKSEMIQMLSHEFRTPLQGIMGIASTMLSDMSPEEGDWELADGWSTVLASARLLLTLINNILDLGKMDANKMGEIELSSVPVFAPIRESIEFCTHFAALSETKLVFDSPECEWTMMVNRTRLQQILVNLLSNAIKYGSGSSVHVSVRQCSLADAAIEAQNAGASDLKFVDSNLVDWSKYSDQVVTVVSVQDHGRGIPAGEWGSLFGEFVQLKLSQEIDRKYANSGAKTVGQTSGSGLGLSLVLKFVTRMNGHVWATNSNAGGAIFSFCFPEGEEVKVNQMDDVSQQSSRRELALAREDIDWLQVMVVDDSMINLKVLKRMLSRLGVKSVQTFSDGSYAMDHLKKIKDPKSLPNLILSDLQMPIMTGFELMGHLREISLFEDTPTVMACSADWSAETKTKCMDAGFDGILRKPILLSDLQNFLVENFVDKSL